MDEKSEKYICLLYLASPVPRPQLRAKGKAVSLLAYVVIHSSSRRVVGFRKYLINRRGFDMNAVILQNQMQRERANQLEQRGVPLAAAIRMFEKYARKKFKGKLHFVTDGQEPLRQWMYPKALAQGITLPEYYSYFHDLRQEFQTFYRMQKKPECIKDMILLLNKSPSTEYKFDIKELQDMVTIVRTMLKHGKEFDNPERIKLRLESITFNVNDVLGSTDIVRARGFPFSFTEQDVVNFFIGLNIADGGIAMCLDYSGFKNGVALVRFENQELRNMALKRNTYLITVDNFTRHVEVHIASAEDFLDAVALSKTGAREFLSMRGRAAIYMEGLPYNCTAKHVLKFFQEGHNPCEVMDGENGVWLLKKVGGGITAEALVLFAEEEDAGKALTKHQKPIGYQRIKLSRKRAAEVQEIFYRHMNETTFGTQQQLRGQTSPMPLKRKYSHISEAPKYFIRMSKVPGYVQLSDILHFIGRHYKHIVDEGVQIISNRSNALCWEVIVEMKTKQSAFLLVQEKHLRCMIVQHRRNFIEVYQCNTIAAQEAIKESVPPPKVAAMLPPGGPMQPPYYFPVPTVSPYVFTQHVLPNAAMVPNNFVVSYPPPYNWSYPSTSASAAPYYMNVQPPIPAAQASQPIPNQYGPWVGGSHPAAGPPLYYGFSHNAYMHTNTAEAPNTMFDFQNTTSII